MRKLHVVTRTVARSSDPDQPPTYPLVFYRYAFAFGRPIGRWVSVRGLKRIPWFRLI